MIECRDLTLRQARRLPPIPSGFVTEHVFHLERGANEGLLCWRLREVHLEAPFRKTYDSGKLDEWLATYQDSVGKDRLRFAVALEGNRPIGLVTWAPIEWNNIIWLVDIRVDPGRRRHGTGGLLLAHVQDSARRLPARGILVETQINNYPALQFYRRHGFEISGFNDHQYSNHDFEVQDVAVFLFWEAV